MRQLPLVVLCGCGQIFGLNSPSHGTPADGAISDTRGSDAQAVGCTTIADCPTSVCLPSGTCAADTDVAWLDPSSTVSTPCTMAMPCYRVLDALSTLRPYIRVHGAITNLSGINRPVGIFGEPGAAFGQGGSSQISVQSTVDIHDLAFAGTCISASTSASLSLIHVSISNCTNYGVNAAGQLTIDRSTITGNRSGAVLLNSNIGRAASFSITNSFIVGNGLMMMNNVGGVYVAATTIAPGSRLDFNTIVDNAGKLGGTAAAGGVYCTDTAFHGASNIIAHNNVGGDYNNSQANTAGGCTFTGSIIESDDTNLAFVGNGDYHIGAGSTAIDAAMTPPVTDHDIDGDPRPKGNGYDIGADEYP